ncbi:uncharacterized protein TRUGW13939_10030 [Talaromyces rugulosus]|uniref:Class II aldolase/adducin N-terminal domain-containing protein n=1 Tax=Talaromyces rugulosus TaxID=121627 RepID=A0A7H8RBL3_TALRU|nr:uncharacterized protein TRUGW13939_10030 [Talaromyces rugulosus]QKX62865.1 hypothetical protein TRUGW13939_10030 [Talaromyces rugulosus]
MMAESSISSSTDVLKRTFISGCHILHHHRVLDAYGHISVRNPRRHDTFFMPRNLAPGLISSAEDILEYFVDDAAPVDPLSPNGYVERFIHSEIYRRYPEVQSVVHSHAPSVLPYTITDVEMRPCVHMSGFLGQSVQKFDVSQFYAKDDTRDLLIRNKSLGARFAESFSRPDQTLHGPVVLMRGHGFTVIGGSIEESVFRAIYTAENARIQTTAMAIDASDRGREPDNKGLHYLQDSELVDTTEMTRWSVMRPWKLWVREVETTGLYENSA